MIQKVTDNIIFGFVILLSAAKYRYMKFLSEAVNKIGAFLSGNSEERIDDNHVLYLLTVMIGSFHCLLLVLFLIYDVTFMVFINICSIFIYIIIFNMIQKNKPRKILNVVYAEIIIHLLLAIICVGSECGFDLYTIALIPVVYYCGYIIRRQNRQFAPLPYDLGILFAWLFAQIYPEMQTAIYPFGGVEIHQIVYSFNSFFVMVGVLIFIGAFLSQILSTEKRFENENVKLDTISKTDTLTSLENRRSVQVYIESLPAGSSYCVVMMDIDDFKNINDTYGHDCGDKVLIHLSDIMKTNLRKTDHICRWGGEEILIILLDTPKTAALRIVEKIRKIIELDSLVYEDRKVNVTVTCGVAEKRGNESFEEAVKRSDIYLYYGKNQGKNITVSEDYVNG